MHTSLLSAAQPERHRELKRTPSIPTKKKSSRGNGCRRRRKRGQSDRLDFGQAVEDISIKKEITIWQAKTAVFSVYKGSDQAGGAVDSLVRAP
jgi:hypothetical protein